MIPYGRETMYAKGKVQEYGTREEQKERLGEATRNGARASVGSRRVIWVRDRCAAAGVISFVSQIPMCSSIQKKEG